MKTRTMTIIELRGACKMQRVLLSLFLMLFVSLQGCSKKTEESLEESRGKYQADTCVSNLKILAIGCAQFADAHNGMTPTSFDDLKPYVEKLPDRLICPAAKDQNSPSYKLVGGGKEWQAAETYILIEEVEPNHNGKRTVLYSDGGVEQR